MGLAVRVWPFRVYSFPSQIVISKDIETAVHQANLSLLAWLNIQDVDNLKFDSFMSSDLGKPFSNILLGPAK